jgi:hypothetical protein
VLNYTVNGLDLLALTPVETTTLKNDVICKHAESMTPPVGCDHSTGLLDNANIMITVTLTQGTIASAALHKVQKPSVLEETSAKSSTGNASTHMEVHISCNGDVHHDCSSIGSWGNVEEAIANGIVESVAHNLNLPVQVAVQAIELIPNTKPGGAGCHVKHPTRSGNCQPRRWELDTWGMMHANAFQSEQACMSRKWGHDKWYFSWGGLNGTCKRSSPADSMWVYVEESLPSIASHKPGCYIRMVAKNCGCSPTPFWKLDTWYNGAGQSPQSDSEAACLTRKAGHDAYCASLKPGCVSNSTSQWHFLAVA